MTAQNQDNQISTLLKVGLVGFVLWSLLPTKAQQELRSIGNQIYNGLASYQRQKEEEERRRQIHDILTRAFHGPIPLINIDLGMSSENKVAEIINAARPVPPDTSANKAHEADAAWREKIVHPSVILILGKRGGGKSALGYRLLELLKYTADVYVVGLPFSARGKLPDWIGITPVLEDLPNNSIALIDEAYLAYHSRGSMAVESKAMSQALNLSRQKGQTLIFVTQEARQVDKNIASSANVVVFKDLGMLQLAFDRPELNTLAAQAHKAFETVSGDRRRWSYLYAPDTDFAGLLPNELASFWKPGLSKIYAGTSSKSVPVKRAPKKLTREQKAELAKELRAQGETYKQIARELGVSVGTVVNYLKDYPYRSSK